MIGTKRLQLGPAPIADGGEHSASEQAFLARDRARRFGKKYYRHANGVSPEFVIPGR